MLLVASDFGLDNVRPGFIVGGVIGFLLGLRYPRHFTWLDLLFPYHRDLANIFRLLIISCEAHSIASLKVCSNPMPHKHFSIAVRELAVSFHKETV